jgi:hypothetical protein
MKDYYFDSYKLAEAQLTFARVGYSQEVKRLGEAIAKAQDLETVKKLTEELARATEAIIELEKSYKYYLEEYKKCTCASEE